MQNLILRHRNNHTRAHIHRVEGTSMTVENTVRAPVRELSITGQSLQQGTPSPQIPAPIQSVGSPNGFTLVAQGKNLFDQKDQLQRLTAYAKTYTPDNVLPVEELWLGVKALKCKARCLRQGNSSYFSVLKDCFAPLTRYTVSFDYAYPEQTEQNQQFYLMFLYDDDTSDYVAIGNTTHPVQWRRQTAVSNASKTLREITYSWSSSTGTIYLNFENYQIEKGFEATPYLPFYSPISQNFPALRSIPGSGVADTISIDPNGMAILCRRVGLLQLNGSELWQKTTNGATDEKNFFYIGGILRNETIPPICDYFVHRNISIGEANTGFVTSHSVTRFRPNLAEVTDVASWKKWLTEHPVTIQYALAEPVMKPLGTVSLITAPYYTYIFTDSPLPPHCSATLPILG